MEHQKSVEDFIKARIENKTEHTKQLLLDSGKVGHTLANHADIALIGEVRIGEQSYAAYSAPLIKGCGMTEEHMVKADKIAFLSPGVLPLEDIVMALWHYQSKYQAPTEVADILLQMHSGLNSIEEVVPDYMEDRSVRSQTLLSEAMAKTLGHLLHLFALVDLDPTAVLAKLLHELREDV